MYNIYYTKYTNIIVRDGTVFATQNKRTEEAMTKFEMEEKELKEKMEFCSLLIKYGKMVDATQEQSVKAFKLKENFEEELRVLRLKNGK